MGNYSFSIYLMGAKVAFANGFSNSFEAKKSAAERIDYIISNNLCTHVWKTDFSVEVMKNV